MMTLAQQDVTWGETLVIAAFRWPGGINPAVHRIQALVGPHIGVRNTFAKLLRVEDVADLGDRDLFRAWLLLVALGQEPIDYGIADDAVPSGYDVVMLRDKLPRLDSNQQPSGYQSAQVVDLAARRAERAE